MASGLPKPLKIGAEERQRDAQNLEFNVKENVCNIRGVFVVLKQAGGKNEEVRFKSGEFVYLSWNWMALRKTGSENWTCHEPDLVKQPRSLPGIAPVVEFHTRL